MDSSPTLGAAGVEEPKANTESGYVQIFRASALIGGSTAIGVLLGLIRTKVLALLLGPAGIGLFGIYGAIVDLAATVAGLGIASSGVRQVAEATGENDSRKIEATVRALRRLSIGLGVIGAVVLVALALPVSKVTFDSGAHAAAIVVLGAAVLLRCVAAGEAALLQGLRRIPELALTSIVGAIAATLGSIGLVWWLGEAGIAASIVLTSAAGLAATLWFSTRVRSRIPDLGGAELRGLYSGLLGLGIVFMVSALVQHVGAYVVRTTTYRELGAEAAGHYHAAWTIGSMYLGMILTAMGTDFYPRLVAGFGDPRRCNQIVNEQVYASLLLAGPGVLATLTFSSLALSLLYSSAFEPASATLRWICVGMAMRIVTWPLGYIIVASGRKATLLWVELAWTVFYISMSWVMIKSAGLVGAGVAFALSYVLHWAVVFPIARRLTGFAWSHENWRLIVAYLASIALVAASFEIGGQVAGLLVGSILVLASLAYALRQSWKLVQSEVLPKGIRQWLGQVARRFSPTDPP